MGFIMDGLDAEAYDRTYSDGQLIRRIIQYFKPKVPLMINDYDFSGTERMSGYGIPDPNFK